MRYVLCALAVVGLVITAGQPHVQAEVLTYEFHGTFTSSDDSLLNVTFHGTFSYATEGNGFSQQTTSRLTIGTTIYTRSALLSPAQGASTLLELSTTGSLPSWLLGIDFLSSPSLNAPLPLSTVESISLIFFDENGQLSSGQGSGNVTVALVPDQDGDGIPDADDVCPVSDLSATVVIGSCDSGVPNTLFPTGCTLSDQIAELADGARNRGQLAGAVTRLANMLRKAGIIDGEQKKAIQSCARGG